MPQAQSGICAEANLHATHLFFNVLDGHDHNIARFFATFVEIQERYESEFSEAQVSSIIAIGTQYWPHIYTAGIPKTLAGFPQFEHPEHPTPSRPLDLMIQIRSDRVDVNHLFAMEVMAGLDGHVELVEQVKCFRFLDGRDLNGFTYDFGAPHGRKKQKVALVGDEDSLFIAGSYIHVQRFRHNLARWQQIALAEQEIIMGRTRLDNHDVQYAPANCFAKRNELIDNEDERLFLNQGMPFADIQHQGFLNVICAASGYAFQTLLKHRLGYADDEGPDMWLDFSEADFGAAFFAPSVNLLKQLGHTSSSSD